MWFGVVFRVQVNVIQGIREEISPFDHLFADLYVLTNIPSEGGSSDEDSLRLSDAGFENRQFIFPRGEGDGCEIFMEWCRGGGAAEMTRK